MGGTDVPDPEKLLLRLSDGEQLDEGEIEAIVEMLASVDAEEPGRALSVDDIYSMIVVLRRAKVLDAKPVLERFLQMRDPLTVALVLETLALDWGLAADYLEQAISFALGAAWDEDQDVQQAALKILGEHLHSIGIGDGREPDAQERQVLELLFAVFEDETAEDWTRQAAYCALARASGRSLEDLPHDCVALDLSDGSADLDQALLARLKNSFQP